MWAEKNYNFNFGILIVSYNEFRDCMPVKKQSTNLGPLVQGSFFFSGEGVWVLANFSYSLFEVGPLM